MCVQQWSAKQRSEEQGSGRQRPLPINEICSFGSDSSSTRNATTARRCETFTTSQAPVGQGRQTLAETQLRQKRTILPGGDLKARRENIVAFDPNVEAKAVAVRTSEMLVAVLLTASTV